MNEAEVVMADLNIMSLATNYQKWLVDRIRPYLGSHILEIGAGVGNNTEFLASAERLVCVEPLPEAAEHLQKRFKNHPQLEIVQRSILDPSLPQILRQRFDTAVCVNVLEHIEDDRLAARHVHRLLAPGGRFLLVVPAIPFLYGTIDRNVGHFRRYSKKTIRTVLEEAEFKVEKLQWMNMPGAFGWFLTNRILRQAHQTAGQVGFYDRIVVPLARRIERIVPPPFGLSLVVVARKET